MGGHFNYTESGKNAVVVTPAMEAGLSHTAWTIADMVRLLEPKSILDGLSLVAA